MATTNALPRDGQDIVVRYENNLERLHAQADEEIMILNDVGLADLIEEQRASHGALMSRLNGMFIKHLETTWVPRTLLKAADEKNRMLFQHALLGMPPAHEEEALPQVRDAIVKAVEAALDRGAPSLLKAYSASVLQPMREAIQGVVKQAIMDVLSAHGATLGVQVDSQILSEHQHDQIRSWLQDVSGLASPEQVKLELLYRASRDGWRAQDFHSRCDDKGPTITVIKNTDGFVFGGYADGPWSSHNNWTHSSQAFLFSLHSPSGVGPVKLPLVQNHQYAMQCHASYGPTFGCTPHDIYVADGANGNANSYTNFGSTYQLPSGQSARTFFTGKNNFQAAEVEVYQVQL